MKKLFLVLIGLGLSLPTLTKAVEPLPAPDLGELLTSASSTFTALWDYFGDWTSWIIGVLFFGAIITLVFLLLGKLFHRD